MVAAAHLGAQPLGDRADHLVGNVEAVGLVEPAEIVDRDHQQAAGAALVDRLLQRVSSTSVRCQRFISPVRPSKCDR